jgi:hypothetical protein
MANMGDAPAIHTSAIVFGPVKAKTIKITNQSASIHDDQSNNQPVNGLVITAATVDSKVFNKQRVVPCLYRRRGAAAVFPRTSGFLWRLPQNELHGCSQEAKT